MPGCSTYDPTELGTRIGTNIRSAIEFNGRSITVVAGLAGMSREYLQRVLAGQQSITVEKLVAIAEALEISPCSLLEETSTET